MFGTLKPNLCSLNRSKKSDYRRHYCGTCKALGDHYGQLSRVSLTYDAVLLSMVVEGLQAAPAQRGSCRCPMMPLKHRATLTPDSVAMQVSSAVQVVLTDQWFADHRLDGQRTLGSLRRLTEGKARDALDTLAGLGVDLSGAADLATRQHQLEAEATSSVAAVVAPTAELLRAVFSQIPNLPGVVEGVDVEAHEALGELGAAIGAAIYLIDALEDLPRDLDRGAFNPCLTTDDAARCLSTQRLGVVIEDLERALEVIKDAAAMISWRRNGLLIDHVLCQRLPSRARKAIADADALRSVEPAAPLSFWLRRWRGLLAIGLFFLAFGRKIFRRRRSPERCRTADNASTCAVLQPTPLTTNLGGPLFMSAGDPPEGGGEPSSPLGGLLERMEEEEEEEEGGLDAQTSNADSSFQGGDSGEGLLEDIADTVIDAVDVIDLAVDGEIEDVGDVAEECCGCEDTDCCSCDACGCDGCDACSDCGYCECDGCGCCECDGCCGCGCDC